MAIEDIVLPKKYKDSKILFEKNLDDWRKKTEAAFASYKLNLTQLVKDCFSAGYSYDNDGSPNKPISLEDRLNSLTTGDFDLPGTKSDTFTINSDGNGVTLSSAGQTSTHVYTFPDEDGDVVLRLATQTIANKTFSDNLKFDSGTNFSGIFDHANSASRTWTLPDIAGGVLLDSYVKVNGPGSGVATVVNTDTSTDYQQNLPAADGTLLINSKFPFLVSNLSFRRVTVTTSNDAIRLTSADGTPLSTENPGYLTMPGYLSDRVNLTTHTFTQDIDLKVSGAHWGLDGKGDISDAILRIGFVVNADSVGFAVSYLGSKHLPLAQAVQRSGSQTQASVQFPYMLLISSGLTTDNVAFFECGYIYGSFTDATNIWSFSDASRSDPILGQTADGLWQTWKPTITGFSGSPSSNCKWLQTGNLVFCEIQISGTSNANTFTLTLPHTSVNGMTGSAEGMAAVVDNGIALTTPGRVFVLNTSNLLQVFTTLASGVFTNVGSKAARVNFVYEPSMST